MATEVTWALATSMSWRTKAFRGANPTANPDPIGCRSLVVLRFMVLQASDEPPFHGHGTSLAATAPSQTGKASFVLTFILIRT
jgi:hypothetical protein